MTLLTLGTMIFVIGSIYGGLALMLRLALKSNGKN